MNDKLTYTIPEAAKATGVSRATLYRRIKAGELTTLSWCGRTLIRAEVLQRALDDASGQRAA